MQKKGSTYSDIHTFANAVTKIEKFLKRAVSQKRRYYEPTRMLYLKLAQKLEACAKLAYQLAGKHVEEDASVVPKLVEKVTEQTSVQVKEVISEPAFELALSTMDNPAPRIPSSTINKQTSRKIVSMYLKSGKKLSSCVDAKQSEEASKCALLLSMWLQLRFGKKSDMFRYNPENIKVWVDRFIYAYGYHWRYHLLSKFETDLQDWFTSLRKVDCKYPLPAFIFNMEDDDDPDMYCAESLLLERLLKIVIYSDEFYPQQLHSIERKVLMHHPEYAKLTDTELLSECSQI